MGYLHALSGTPVDVPIPAPGDPQPPIWPLVVGAHGGYLETRSTPADGSCGVSGYPCRHPGLDVAGTSGTPVVAPESGTVVAAGDGSAAPFVGYGPWLVIIAGRDSGKFHLLAHLEPATAAMAEVGREVAAGDAIGATSSANHTHWEVRDQPVPDFAAGQTNFDNNSDPLAWLAAAQRGALGTALIVGSAALFLWLLWRRR